MSYKAGARDAPGPTGMTAEEQGVKGMYVRVFGRSLRTACTGAIVALAAAGGVGCAGTGPAGSMSSVAPLRTLDDFGRCVYGSAGPVVVDFYGPRCIPCKLLAPTLAGLADRYGRQVRFFRVNCDESMALAVQHDVRAYPSVVLFVDGREHTRWVGQMPAKPYRDVLDRVVARASRPAPTSCALPPASGCAGSACRAPTAGCGLLDPRPE